jgi:hypothetical protein
VKKRSVLSHSLVKILRDFNETVVARPGGQTDFVIVPGDRKDVGNEVELVQKDKDRGPVFGEPKGIKTAQLNHSIPARRGTRLDNGSGTANTIFCKRLGLSAAGGGEEVKNFVFVNSGLRRVELSGGKEWGDTVRVSQNFRKNAGSGQAI